MVVFMTVSASIPAGCSPHTTSALSNVPVSTLDQPDPADRAGQAVVASPGEWVRYSTPGPEGAEYVAVCLPAFSPATVHRDE